MSTPINHLVFGATSSIGSSFIYALSNGLNLENNESNIIHYIKELFNFHTRAIESSKELNTKYNNNNNIDIFVSKKSYKNLYKKQNFLSIFSLNFTYKTKKILFYIIYIINFIILYYLLFNILFVNTIKKILNYSLLLSILFKILLLIFLFFFNYYIIIHYYKKILHFLTYRRSCYKFYYNKLISSYNDITNEQKESYHYIWLVLPSPFLQHHFIPSSNTTTDSLYESYSNIIKDKEYDNLSFNINQLLKEFKNAKVIIVSNNFKDMDLLINNIENEDDKLRLCSLTNPFYAYHAPLKYERFSLVRLYTGAAPAYLEHYTNREERSNDNDKEEATEQKLDATTKLYYNPIVTYYTEEPIVVAAGSKDLREDIVKLLNLSGLKTKEWIYSSNAHEIVSFNSHCLYSSIILLLKGNEWNFSTLNDKLYFEVIHEASFINSLIVLQRYHNKFAKLKKEYKEKHNLILENNSILDDDEILLNNEFDQYNSIFDNNNNKNLLLNYNENDIKKFILDFNYLVRSIKPFEVSRYLFKFLYQNTTFLPFDFERYCLNLYNPTNKLSSLYLEEYLIQVSKQIEICKSFNSSHQSLYTLYRKASERDYE